MKAVIACVCGTLGVLGVIGVIGVAVSSATADVVVDGPIHRLGGDLIGCSPARLGGLAR